MSPWLLMRMGFSPISLTIYSLRSKVTIFIFFAHFSIVMFIYFFVVVLYKFKILNLFAISHTNIFLSLPIF